MARSQAMTNPYAPPRAAVQDVQDPSDTLVPADRGTRLGAAFLDGLIFGGMVYLPFLLSGILTGGFPGSARGSGAGVFVLGIGSLFTLAGLGTWVVFTVKYVNENGQSIAKRMLGIKVVRTDGSPITLGRIFWMRNVLNSVLGIIPFYGIVDALFIFGEARQCLHDKLADTIVVLA